MDRCQDLRRGFRKRDRSRRDMLRGHRNQTRTPKMLAVCRWRRRIWRKQLAIDSCRHVVAFSVYQLMICDSRRLHDAFEPSSVSGSVFGFRGCCAADTRHVFSEHFSNQFLSGKSSHLASYWRYATCKLLFFCHIPLGAKKTAS